MNKFLLFLSLALLFSCGKQSDTPSGGQSSGVNIDKLLSKMTMEEKMAQISSVYLGKTPNGKWSDITKEQMESKLSHGIGQLCQTGKRRTPKQIVAFNNKVQRYLVEETRLGIPAICHEEGLHGMIANGVTSFPTPIAMSCSWNDQLVNKVYDKVGRELRAVGMTLTLSPVLDVAREPRWGRFEETFGEDPVLVSRMGVAAVKGFQGSGNFPDSNHVIATGKHFTGYAYPSGGHNTAPPMSTPDNLWNVQLLPFKNAIQKAELYGIMPAYNEIYGVPCHANEWLLTDVLKKKFGFQGLIVSDYGGVSGIKSKHKVAATKKEAALQAFNAGVDYDLPNNTMYKHIPELIKEGKCSEEQLNQKVKRVLTIKKRLGLFKDPYASVEESKIVGNEAGKKLALKIAEQSVVLLKNKNDLLPLQDIKGKTIAVIGPNSDNCILGSYYGTPNYTVSVLEGVKKQFGKENTVLHAKGCHITRSHYDSVKVAKKNPEDPDKYNIYKKTVLSTPKQDEKLLNKACQVAQKADYVFLCIGGNMDLTKESFPGKPKGDRTFLNLTPSQKELVNRLSQLNTKLISLLIHGGPIADKEMVNHSDALLDCHYQGQETGNAITNILSGKVNPSGKLCYTVPMGSGYLPSYYNYKPSARRGYGYSSNKPLFPFGYGMSYTQFEYGTARYSDTILTDNQPVRIKIKVNNTGDRDGYEVVQLYLRDKVSSITRPVKELKDFKKVFIPAGQHKIVTFTLNKETLKFYNAERNYVAEEGTFDIMVGSSSLDKDLNTQKITYKK